MIYFRRRQFYGPDRHTDPKWHIASSAPVEYEHVTALCGYTQRHYRGHLLVSHVKQPKPAASVCAKCRAKMATATPAP